MDQEELNKKRERALAALPDDKQPDLEKIKKVALFRMSAARDVLELIAEVERLRAEIKQSKEIVVQDEKAVLQS